MSKVHDLVVRFRLVLGIPILGGEKYTKNDLKEVWFSSEVKIQELWVLKKEANEVLNGNTYEVGSGRD